MTHKPRITAWVLRVLGLLALSLAGAGCGGGSESGRLEDQSDFHVQLAHGHWQAGEVPRAIEEAQIALAIDPENADAHYLLGFIFSGRQMFPESIQHYRQALLLRPRWLEVKNNLGVVYLQLERWEEAAILFEELTTVPSYQTPGHAYNNLGWAHLSMGQPREALRHFEMATYLQPDLCLAYNNAGLARLELEDLRGAEEAFQEAIHRCDNYAEPRFRLARLRQSAGRFAEARQLFAQCAELVPRATLGRRCREYLE
jgi:type IV pilus assembly protein PilF